MPDGPVSHGSIGPGSAAQATSKRRNRQHARSAAMNAALRSADSGVPSDRRSSPPGSASRPMAPTDTSARSRSARSASARSVRRRAIGRSSVVALVIGPVRVAMSSCLG